MPEAPRLITTADDLQALAEQVRAGGRLALDTEFVWERTYGPTLGVVQIATEGAVAVLDAIALPDLEPLFPLLRDPAIPVVLHGGGQDLEIFAQLMGEPIRAVVDTQVLAAFLGYGLQIGLLPLLERALKVRIRKDQTYTDWTRRPLKPEQVVYAREDVVHLLLLHDKLQHGLVSRGRVEWATEELRTLEDPGRYAPLPDEERYQAVKGWQRLGGKELAVLRAIAAWREQAARRANIRPGFIANDVVLTSLAARPVASVEELRGVRGLSPGTVDRHGRALVAAIKEGVACPKERWPEPPGRTRRQSPPTGLGALLRAAVQTVADREEIAPEVIAGTRDIEALAGRAGSGGLDELPEDLPIAHGWRRKLVGETMLAIARGETAMRYDPVKREVLGEPVAARAKR